MSTTISAVILNLLVVGLPYLGITVGDAALTTTIQTVTAIVTGLWIWYRRTTRGDVSALGMRKEESPEKVV